LMRLVSLCPSLTETVFTLGRGRDLVGITEWCVHPAEGVSRVEKVGGTKDPHLERIVELAPDLVLLNEEENRREDAEALVAAGLRCHTSFPRSPAEAAACVRSLGAVLGRDPEAEAIAREIETRVEELKRSRERLSPVPYAYIIWRKPWMAAGPGTYVDALLGLAGGSNVIGGRKGRYPQVSASELAAANPTWVLLASEPLPFGPQHADELAEESGIPRERFRFVDGELLSWHGARTPAGLDYASGLLRESAPAS
jgi:iron complex transport system substrate-binding protein